MARMIIADHEYVMSRYKLEKRKDIEALVARAVQVNIPFNNAVIAHSWAYKINQSAYIFGHRPLWLYYLEGGHPSRSIFNNSSTYAIIDSNDFGVTRYVHFASRLSRDTPFSELLT